MKPDLLWIGGLLATGFVLFAAGVILPERGGIGRRVWSVPHEEVGRNPSIWQRANLLFAASGVLSTIGLFLFALQLYEAGSRLLAPISAVLFLVANVFWLVFSAYRSAVIPWAASSWEENGDIPPAYKPISSWAYMLGSYYMMLGYLATAVLGAAIVQTGFLSSWIGWLGIVWGIGLAGVMAIGWPKPAGEEGTIAHIPAWVQIIPTVVAVALILESA